VPRTIDEDLRRETEFLPAYNRFRDQVQNIVDMPDVTVDLLFRFLRQNGGRPSKRRHENEFALLADDETVAAEAAYVATFGDEQNESRS
jgi:hypothetical protein